MATSSHVPSQAQLAADLISVSSLPTGWAVTSQADTSTSNCVHDIQDLADPTASARAAFDENGSTPLLQEILASFPSGSNAYATIVAHENASACHQFSEQSSGQTASITMGAMSFPRFGSKSSAYQLTASVSGGETFYEDLVVALKGNVVMILGLADVIPVDTSQLQQFARMTTVIISF